MFSRFVPSIGSCSQFCLILQSQRVAVPFPPTFASPWRNSFVQIHGGTPVMKAKFGITSHKRPKNDLNWEVGSSYGTNKRSLPNPLFPYELVINPLYYTRTFCLFGVVILRWFLACLQASFPVLLTLLLPLRRRAVVTTCLRKVKHRITAPLRVPRFVVPPLALTVSTRNPMYARIPPS